jgi:hypothetical protein
MTDPGVLPSWYILTMHSSFVAMTQLENYISQPCLTESIYATFWVILFNFYEYLPMGVINVYFLLAMQPKFLALFFCRLISIGCVTALPMGVAPEAIAEIFGYRLKRIDKFVPYTSSRINCWFCSLLNRFSLCVHCKPPSRRQGKPVHLDSILRILSDPFSLLFTLFIRTCFLDTLTPLCYLHCKKIPEIYFGPYHFRGPLARAYK